MRPLPKVEVTSGWWLPTWVVRGLAAAAALACVSLVATNQAQWFAVAVLVAVTLLRPSGAAPKLLAIAIGVMLVISEAGRYTLVSASVVVGAHLLAILTAVAGDLNPTTRIEARVLAAPLLRLVAIQALVQPLAWFTAGPSLEGVTIGWLPLVAAIAVASVAWVALATVNQHGG